MSCVCQRESWQSEKIHRMKSLLTSNEENSKFLPVRLFVIRFKKKCGHAQLLTTFHTRTPTHPSGICCEANFHIWLKGQKLEQEASKQSSENRLTQWCIVVFGGRYCNGAWDPLQCPFCLTRYAFHLKSESWDVACDSVPDVEQDAWLFFILVDVIKHHTLPAALSQQDIVKSTYFLPDSLLLFQSYETVLLACFACRVLVGQLSFAFEIDSSCSFSSVFVFSIITLPPYLIFFLFGKKLSFHVWLAWNVRFLPASTSPSLSPIPHAPTHPPWGETVAANLSLQPVPPHRCDILRVQGKGNVSLPALSTLQSVNRACHQPLGRPLWRTISVPSCNTPATTSWNKLGGVGWEIRVVCV